LRTQPQLLPKRYLNAGQVLSGSRKQKLQPTWKGRNMCSDELGTYGIAVNHQVGNA